jgi:hypothetical protein
MKRKPQPKPRRKLRPATLHPEFERVMAALRSAFGAAPLTLPTPELYLGMARILMDEALALHRGSGNAIHRPRPCP